MPILCSSEEKDARISVKMLFQAYLIRNFFSCAVMQLHQNLYMARLMP